MSQKKFYQCTPQERLTELINAGHLSADDAQILSGVNGLDLDTANHMIENVVGLFSLPLGIAQNFIVNGKKIQVPMVIEEPSVVAAASNAAKIVAQNGGFTAQADAPIMIGQLQIVKIPDLKAARKAIRRNRISLLTEIAGYNRVLLEVGGGPVDLKVKQFKKSPIGPFLVVYLLMHVADAMGANAINSALEQITPRIEAITGGEARLRILSNLADRRLVRARCVIVPETLATDEFSGEEVRDRILDAAALAEVDPYRAVTHNKGIMNGIDAVLIATGNDWRAVEAGAHGYASKHKRNKPLSHWSSDENGNLVGVLELPMAIGTVGGATRVHPTARVALNLLKVENAKDLSETIAAVGLAQNFAALRALSTVGIQKGHMSLHARQIAIAAGATGEQIETVAAQLRADQKITIQHAQEILSRL